jgi:thiamine biosynthesis lipoprotein
VLLHTVTGSYFNTVVTITAACTPVLLEQALSMCDYYNVLLSKTIPGSDVWRINHACGVPIDVSEHTINIIKLAMEMHDASEGRFNIAIGSVMELWDFNDGNGCLPCEKSLGGALGNIDCGLICLSGCNVSIPDGMQIDLGGIAKGYIADRVVEYLRENGVQSALVNLGGNIATIGQKPDGAPCKIGLQVPFTDRSYRDKYWSTVDCINESVVTSGSYERGFQKDNRWYHHIIDPATGMPYDSDILSVTVCSPSSFLADALATALFLLGEKKGMELAKQYGVDVAYYLRGNRVITNSGMIKRLHCYDTHISKDQDAKGN